MARTRPKKQHVLPKKRKAASKKPKGAPKKRRTTPNTAKAAGKKRATAPVKTPPAPSVAPAATTPAPSPARRGAQTAREALTVPSIKGEVNQVLSAVSPRPPNPIEACMSLEFELRLTDDIKRGLSNSFQRIARKSKPDARISDDECGDLDVVEDAWVLVTEKSGLSLDKECE